ncbi:MAG: aminopeptidase P family protein [Eubacteriales bacterium]|nr:aminopeptidase P family protein [Eubacteriales bacterium]
MREQITKLRAAMKSAGIDMYYVTMDDDHQSEYVGAYYREIAELTGFTGSAGKLLVTDEEAALWTDGRYFVQAAAQLSGSGVQLMKQGEPETPELSAYAALHIPEGGVLGFNGTCVSDTEAKALIAALSGKHVSVCWEKDLPDEVWEGRPSPEEAPLFILEEKYSGKSASEKLAWLRGELAKCGAFAHVITSLDDIAWLLNLRGADVPCNPVFLSFFMMDGDEMRLYLTEGHLTKEVREYLNALHVTPVTKVSQVYADVAALSGKAVLMEREKTNFALISSVAEDCTIVDRMLPTTIAKAKKNPVEMENLRLAHIKDGAALTRFVYWFKQNIGKTEMTEWSAAEKLHTFRAQNEHFLGESFTTIAAYGANAAMCHYAPTKEQHAEIRPEGMFLVDSGGQYPEGTTDVTRTIACGKASAEEKRDFTLSVIANLRLADARFLEGTSGLVLDYIAREPFWTRGLNYNHGTGHGVGFCLNVHERPVGIRYKMIAAGRDGSPMSEGAFVSDEPGLYIEGSHGVRTENMLMCVNDYSNEYGQFCRFETYTLCPMDRDLLDLSIMTDRDIELLNAYHKKVCETLLPLLNAEEGAWLREACAPVERKERN